MSYNEGIERAREYYNSPDADEFYNTIWGGEDIHVGLYDETRDIRTASHRTVQEMLKHFGELSGKTVLDIGSGYGGSARVLAKERGARMVCVNISEAENERNRMANKAAGLADAIDVRDGSFDDLPLDDASVDAAWSQDAILHAPDRRKVLAEVARVLKPGGDFVFTDPMQADGISDTSALQPIYDRIHLTDLASFEFYKAEMEALGFETVDIVDHTPQLKNHYGRVAEELDARRGEISSGDAFVDRMMTGLNHWVKGVDDGVLAWGIMHFRKK